MTANELTGRHYRVMTGWRTGDCIRIAGPDTYGMAMFPGSQRVWCVSACNRQEWGTKVENITTGIADGSIRWETEDFNPW